MLARQRRFVADASHELRTPLTSVLANLELLAESLDGDEGEAARSALRSSQRMRRLVADLLLLARTDVGRVVPREPCDLAQIVVEAAGELGPVSRRARDRARRPSRGGRRRARRGTPADDQPARERAAPHAARDAHPRATSSTGDGRRRWSSRTTAPACRPSWPPRCSSASCAAPAIVAARSASAWRSSRRSPRPTAASVTLQSPEQGSGARFVVSLPARLRPRRRRAGPSAGA